MKIIVGSTLAALISVARISKTSPVKWVKPTESIGGYFAGLNFDNIPFDAGMVINEPYSVPVLNPTKGDSFPERADRVSYVHLVFNWLKSNGIEFVPIDIFTFFRGKLYPDFFIADNLEVLSSFSISEKNTSLKELSDIALEFEEYHPSRKNKSEVYNTKSYREILTLTSSPLITELLIQPWLDKMMKNVSEFVPAIEHRSIWAPLYYSETLLNFMSGKISADLLKRPFWVPKLKSVNQLVKEIETGINGHVEAIFADKDELHNLINKDSITHKYFFGSQKDYAVLIGNSSDGEPIKSREITLLFGLFECENQVDEVINFVDSEILAYRLTLRNIRVDSRNMQTFVLEFGEGCSSFSDSFLISHASSIFPLIGKVGTMAIKKVLRTKVPIVTNKFRIEKLDELTLSHQYLSENGWIGSIVDFGSSAFNDQCLLGLWNFDER
jgi:hypothetical protein